MSNLNKLEELIRAAGLIKEGEELTGDAIDAACEVLLRKALVPDPAASGVRYYYALATMIDPVRRQQGTVTLYLDEHPIPWASRRVREVKIAEGIDTKIIIGFMIEISKEVYDEQSRENSPILTASTMPPQKK
jgi:hypothetical protein